MSANHLWHRGGATIGAMSMFSFRRHHQWRGNHVSFAKSLSTVFLDRHLSLLHPSQPYTSHNTPPFIYFYFCMSLIVCLIIKGSCKLFKSNNTTTVIQQKVETQKKEVVFPLSTVVVLFDLNNLQDPFIIKQTIKLMQK